MHHIKGSGSTAVIRAETPLALRISTHLCSPSSVPRANPLVISRQGSGDIRGFWCRLSPSRVSQPHTPCSYTAWSDPESRSLSS